MKEPVDAPDPLRAAVVVPTYNNASTLRRVLDEIGRHRLTIIVVNDGSDDHTRHLLGDWTRADEHRRFVLTHQRNRGKAQALLTGFDFARDAGFTHAVTIDSDGQLDPADIPRLLDAARAHPRSVVVGSRRYDLAGYPGKNRLGRVLSNLAVKLECGHRLSDTQCGLRVYPLALLSEVRCVYGRYAFETEFLTRAAWAGAGVVQCPVACRYTLPDAPRVTHFRPWIDTLHGLRLHARLLLRAALPIPHARTWHDADAPPRVLAEGGARWRRVLNWLNPLKAWRGMRRGDIDRAELSTGLGFGVFIGMLPVYGLHTLLCLYTAARLHLNPHVTVAGSALYATPPQGLVMIALSIMTGQFIMHGQLVALAELNLSGLSWFEIAGRFYLEWLVGSLVVGLVFAVLSGLAAYVLFGMIRPSSQAETADEAALLEPVVQPESI